MSARTRQLLEAPIAPTLLRLGAPNVLVMVAQAAAGLIETYFIGKLGVDALSGVALVFPLVMLMQMMSAGAIGGGISSAIARALGARRRDDADSLVLHALLISALFGFVFTVALWLGGEALYRHMGGTGGALRVALVYSSWVFSGAVLVWLFNALASVVRGTGNMATPAAVTCIGTLLLVPLSPALIFGIGPIPALGVAGGAIALLLYYLLGGAWLAWYVASGRSVMAPRLRGFRLRRPLLVDILRVGLAGAVSTVATNVSIGIATALAGAYGTAAIAGYGTAARLEYLGLRRRRLVGCLRQPTLRMQAKTVMPAFFMECALRLRQPVRHAVHDRAGFTRAVRHARGRGGAAVAHAPVRCDRSRGSSWCSAGRTRTRDTRSSFRRSRSAGPPSTVVSTTGPAPRMVLSTTGAGSGPPMSYEYEYDGLLVVNRLGAPCVMVLASPACVGELKVSAWATPATATTAATTRARERRGLFIRKTPYCALVEGPASRRGIGNILVHPRANPIGRAP